MIDPDAVNLLSRLDEPMPLASLLFTAAAAIAGPMPVEQFTKLHALIKPAPGEDRWAEIPWQTDLWEARRQAAAEGKPILLWEMDGHPLGCV
jgi:hypothetical protein